MGQWETNLLCKTCGIQSDHVLLVRGDHEHLHTGILARDIGKLTAGRGAVHLFVDLDAEEIKIAANVCAEDAVVFTDTRREYQNVHAVHLGDIRADDLLDVMIKNIHRQAATVVALIRLLHYYQAVAGNAGNAEP